jgi:hypothetical protein
VALDGHFLDAGDSVAVSREKRLEIKCQEKSKIMLFDLV